MSNSVGPGKGRQECRPQAWTLAPLSNVGQTSWFAAGIPAGLLLFWLCAAVSAQIVVDKNGTGDFRTVQAAIDAAPAIGGVIRIRPGTYYEHIAVDKPHIDLRGMGATPADVVLTFDLSNDTSGGTGKSASTTVTGDDFYAENLTFENSFSKNKPLTQAGSQAVALRVTGDRALFRRVRFLGYQDTLYADGKGCKSEQGPCEPARQYFADCYIEGNVDFIFGDALAFFENCEIHALAHNSVMLTAQSKRYDGEASGYVFDHCRITAEPGAATVYLGRPWRSHGSVVFLNTVMGPEVAAAGWKEWEHDGKPSLPTAFYAEYGSTGPGAHPEGRDPHSKQLTKAEAANFTAKKYLAGADGWDPNQMMLYAKSPARAQRMWGEPPACVRHSCRTFTGLLLLFVASLHAQDTRMVTEPKIPQSCKILLATVEAPDETKLDTTRIQAALDNCPADQAVELKADGPRIAFLSGPLQLRKGVTLVVDANTILYGSRNPRDYEVSPGSCGVVNQAGRGCKALIGGNGVSDAGVMGDGIIDGRGGANLIGKDVSWWDLAQEAKVKNLNQSVPRIMQLARCDNFTLYRITLRNSANFHVSYSGGNGFTAWGVIIDAPKTARNTDGIDPGNSTNVTITRSFIHTGDDNVAIKAGPPGPTSHITISHNHFYTGHGISIGSETDGGASAIRVMDLSIDGADNGIRIKSNSSRGGLVHDVFYSDVCIRDTKNPILMDSNYSYYGDARDKLPVFKDIQLKDVRVLTPGIITLDGYDATHRLGITFDNVMLDVPAAKIIAHHADVRLGPGPVNWDPAGEDVAIAKAGSSGKQNSCQDKFVPMPVK